MKVNIVHVVRKIKSNKKEREQNIELLLFSSICLQSIFENYDASNRQTKSTFDRHKFHRLYTVL